MILEAAKKFREGARQAMIAPRKESNEGRAVDPELQRLLFQVLGALNHASHMITQVLVRGHDPVNAQPVSAEFPETSPAAPEVSEPSPLDRVQEYEPADVQEAAPRRRAPRGSFNPSKDDLRAMRATMTVKAIGEKYGVSMATVVPESASGPRREAPPCAGCQVDWPPLQCRARGLSQVDTPTQRIWLWDASYC